MATHSSILAWRVLWTEEPGGLLSVGSHRVRHDWSDLACMHTCIGEGNGNPLQCSCLENPRDRGAWWAAVYGVTQSQTRLKQLSSSNRMYCRSKSKGQKCHFFRYLKILEHINQVKSTCVSILYIRIFKFRERGNWQYFTILIFNSTLPENMF